MTLSFRVLTLAALVLLALALASCGDETPAPARDAGDGATRSPEATSTLAKAAPLSEEGRQLLDEVAEVRQLEAPPSLRILTVTPRDLPEVYLGPVSDEQQFVFERWTKLYRLLGFLDEEQHMVDIRRSLLGNLSGFYSPGEHIAYVVTEDDGVGVGELGPYDRDTLVHEIIHALQYYHFDIEATYQGLWWTLDARLGLQSVVEGDATVHAARYAGQAHTVPASASQPADVPAPILREDYFPYTAGADWAHEVLTKHGIEVMNGFLADPPATTLILHPELVGTGWEPEQLRTTQFPGLRASLLPLGLRPTAHGVLGEFYALNYLLGDSPYSPDWLQDPQNQTAVEAAAGWAGDYYYLYEGVENWVFLVRIRFVSEEEAREFAEVHRAVATKGAEIVDDGVVTLATQEDGRVTALVEPVGRDVIFAIGTNAQVARAAVEPLVEG